MEFRDLAEADAELVLRWRNSERVARFMYDNRPIQEAGHRAWLSRVIADESCRYWIVEHGGRDVGLVNIVDIDRRNGRCSWGFYLGEEDVPVSVPIAVERRIMRITFVDLGLLKLECEVLDFNARVIKLHEKLGFVREGHFREFIRREDGVFDVIRLGILKSEWEARYGAKGE